MRRSIIAGAAAAALATATMVIVAATAQRTEYLADERSIHAAGSTGVREPMDRLVTLTSVAPMLASHPPTELRRRLVEAKPW